MTSFSLPKLQKPPKFPVVAVLSAHGYTLSSSWEHPILGWPKGTTREQIKGGMKPTIALTSRDVENIQEYANSEEDVLIAVHSLATKGSMPDPLQERVEAAAEEKAKALQEQVDTLTRTVEALLARQVELAEEEVAEAVTGGEPVAAPVKRGPGRPRKKPLPEQPAQ